MSPATVDVTLTPDEAAHALDIAQKRAGRPGGHWHPTELDCRAEAAVSKHIAGHASLEDGSRRAGDTGWDGRLRGGQSYRVLALGGGPADIFVPEEDLERGLVDLFVFVQEQGNGDLRLRGFIPRKEALEVGPPQGVGGRPGRVIPPAKLWDAEWLKNAGRVG